MHKRLKYRVYSLISCLLIVTIMLQMTGCNLFNNLFGKSREAVKIEKVEDNKLKITYSDDSTQLLDDNVTTEPCSCTDKKLLVENYQLQGLDRAEDRCKINVQICKSCDKAYITYINHNSWVDYTIEPTIDTLGESGKQCPDCGFKKDVQKLEFPGHKHNPVTISDEKLNECVIAEYGSLPNPCIETWYSNGSLCECGIWFAKSNNPIGHVIDVDTIEPLQISNVINDCVKFKGYCTNCQEYITLEDEWQLPSTMVSDSTFLIERDYTDHQCKINIYLKSNNILNVPNPELDKFTNQLTTYKLVTNILIFSHDGNHQTIGGEDLLYEYEMTLEDLEAKGGSKGAGLSNGREWGIIECKNCSSWVKVYIIENNS